MITNGVEEEKKVEEDDECIHVYDCSKCFNMNMLMRASMVLSYLRRLLWLILLEYNFNNASVKLNGS